MLRAAIPEQHRQLRRRRCSPTTACRSCPRASSRRRAARLDGRDRDAAGRGRAPAPEGEAHRQRARHAAGRRDRARSTSPAAWSPRSAASAKQALAHKAAGVDIIIAQGTEGGGHTGEIGSVVLWPEVIDAVAPTPVLAAGGIGTGRQIAAALAMGAQGVWTGSLWLTVAGGRRAAGAEGALPRGDQQGHGALALVDRQAVPHAAQRLDRGLGGARDSPKPLGMPLQFMVTVRRGGARPPLRRQGEGGDVQPGRPDRRADERGAAGAGGDLRPRRRSTSKPSSGCSN